MVGIFNSFVDPIFSPLLSMPLILAITIISLLMSLIITIVYKFMTDQSLMKDLKDELKTLQKQMKELRSHPEKMMKVQKKVMDTNMKYMMHSMRPTLITFLPIIIIFGWLNSHLAYEAFLPQQEFTVSALMEKGTSGAVIIEVPDEIELVSDAEQEIINNAATWTMKGDAGEYFLDFNYASESQQKELIIHPSDYADVEMKVRGDSSFKSIRLGNQKTRPLGDSIAIFGWQPGWLAMYIILSIVFSMGLRKALKIY